MSRYPQTVASGVRSGFFQHGYFDRALLEEASKKDGDNEDARSDVTGKVAASVGGTGDVDHDFPLARASAAKGSFAFTDKMSATLQLNSGDTGRRQGIDFKRANITDFPRAKLLRPKRNCPSASDLDAFFAGRSAAEQAVFKALFVPNLELCSWSARQNLKRCTNRRTLAISQSLYLTPIRRPEILRILKIFIMIFASQSTKPAFRSRKQVTILAVEAKDHPPETDGCILRFNEFKESKERAQRNAEISPLRTGSTLTVKDQVRAFRQAQDCAQFDQRYRAAFMRSQTEQLVQIATIDNTGAEALGNPVIANPFPYRLAGTLHRRSRSFDPYHSQTQRNLL
ncbi:hypothetical protein QFC19_001249 [Naganishia cerealis]|uniref:Uncharacterized protein n=1 Tax=Naganishia cerealis TaxID=610337 RepID=A0ACC2WI15_9TREE|nr:hypothetical protein QFC19_001249 [Naganishia cerealis]